MAALKDSDPEGLAAIRGEMARQHADALLSFERAGEVADRLAESIRRTGRLLLLGMGASHAAGRAVEPLYRDLGIDAVAIPLSEQLGQPLPLGGKTVVVTSQSGESAEVLRWFSVIKDRSGVFGVTLEKSSTLARLVPSLTGEGGAEKAFAATRSLTVTLALHAALLRRLGAPTDGAIDILESPLEPDLGAAFAAMRGVRAIVTSGRRLQGLAEAVALGLVELSRLPALSLDGGQLRHGPMEMLGPNVGVVMFRADDETADLVGGLAEATAAAGAPTVIFDAAGRARTGRTVQIILPKSSGLAGLFALLPAAQRFMVDFAASRVSDVGTPLRSTKITRVE